MQFRSHGRRSGAGTMEAHMIRVATLALATAILLPVSVASVADPGSGTSADIPVGASVALGDDAAAVPACGERRQVVADLANQFHEAPVVQGMIDGQAVMEMFVSEEGTWTILATGTDGMTCVIAVGVGFEPTAPAPGTGA